MESDPAASVHDRGPFGVGVEDEATRSVATVQPVPGPEAGGCGEVTEQDAVPGVEALAGIGTVEVPPHTANQDVPHRRNLVGPARRTVGDGDPNGQGTGGAADPRGCGGGLMAVE